jgi:hypothetical protein
MFSNQLANHGFIVGADTEQFAHRVVGFGAGFIDAVAQAELVHTGNA